MHHQNKVRTFELLLYIVFFYFFSVVATGPIDIAEPCEILFSYIYFFLYISFSIHLVSITKGKARIRPIVWAQPN